MIWNLSLAWVGWTSVVVVAALSSVGVYVGRLLYWNSWDVFNNPSAIARNIISQAQDSSLQSIGFTAALPRFSSFCTSRSTHSGIYYRKGKRKKR